MEGESMNEIHITIDRRTVLLILAICAVVALIPVIMHVMSEDELEITPDYHEVRYKVSTEFLEDRAHAILRFTAEHDGILEMKYFYASGEPKVELFKYSKGENEICVLLVDPHAKDMKATLYEKD